MIRSALLLCIYVLVVSHYVFNPSSPMTYSLLWPFRSRIPCRVPIQLRNVFNGSKPLDGNREVSIIPERSPNVTAKAPALSPAMQYRQLLRRGSWDSTLSMDREMEQCEKECGSVVL